MEKELNSNTPPQPCTLGAAVFEMAMYAVIISMLAVGGGALVASQAEPGTVCLTFGLGAVVVFAVTLFRGGIGDWRHLRLLPLLAWTTLLMGAISIGVFVSAASLVAKAYSHSDDFEQFAKQDFALLDTAGTGSVSTVDLDKALMKQDDIQTALFHLRAIDRDATDSVAWTEESGPMVTAFAAAQETDLRSRLLSPDARLRIWTVRNDIAIVGHQLSGHHGPRPEYYVSEAELTGFRCAYAQAHPFWLGAAESLDMADGSWRTACSTGPVEK